MQGTPALSTFAGRGILASSTLATRFVTGIRSLHLECVTRKLPPSLASTKMLLRLLVVASIGSPLVLSQSTAHADSPGFVITDTEPQGFVITTPPPAAELSPLSSSGPSQRSAGLPSTQPAAPSFSRVTDGLSSERPATISKKPECTACSTGYVWEFDDGQKLAESYVAATKRTGKPLPLTRPTCSTNHCSSFSKGTTLPTGRCGCGCDGTSCNCTHSPNAGKPLKDQRYEPGVAASSGQNYSRRGLFGRRWR